MHTLFINAQKECDTNYRRSLFDITQQIRHAVRLKAFNGGALVIPVRGILVRRWRATALLIPVSAGLLSCACGNRPTRALAATDPAPSRAAVQARTHHVVRLTGIIEAVRSHAIVVPEIAGQGGNLTLTKLVPNGAIVHEGDVLAEFDSTAEVTAARDADAKFDDLSHQIEQKIAENHSNAEKRAADLLQAEADLGKAKLEIRKGPILSTIDDQKNAAKLEDAEQHAASLRRSNHFHDLAEAAQLRVLELQRDRQKVALERARDNMQKMQIRAPIGGMIVLQTVWKQGTMGHAQEGDQLWPGSGLLRIFDPSEMQISVSVNEPDGRWLQPGARATVHLDAYPDLTFTAEFVSASPVASTQGESPLRTFDAVFRFLERDPRLLPDLSVALDLQESGSGQSGAGSQPAAASQAAWNARASLNVRSVAWCSGWRAGSPPQAASLPHIFRTQVRRAKSPHEEARG